MGSDFLQLYLNFLDILIFTILTSVITVVGFRAKQATGSQNILTDKSNANYFFIWIDLDWLKHTKGDKFFVSISEISRILSYFILKIIKPGEEFLFVTLIDYFHFWNSLFAAISPNFCVLQSMIDYQFW